MLVTHLAICRGELCMNVLWYGKAFGKIAEQHAAQKWPQEGGITVAEDFALMICGELENVQF